jgi:beta-galactosidase
VFIHKVDNEIGHETSDLDFSDNSLRSWRQWLEETRFGAQEDGGVEKMNAAWGTVFWGVTYSAYREVPLPKWTVPGSAKTTSTEFRANLSPGMLLDFRRFRRDRYTTHRK